MAFRTSTLAPLAQFSEAGLDPTVLAALEKMKVSVPTAVQSQTMPVALNGDDLIVVAQTGSGKTLAFALSILANFGKRPQSRAVVFVPSREMAMQIHAVFAALTTEPAVLVIGGVVDNKQKKQLNKMPRLIIATPGRLNDLLTNNKLLLQRVDMIVIDEADRMLDLGFAPQLQQVQTTMRGKWQTMLFSASFGHAVEEIARIFMPGEIVMVRADEAERPVSTLEQRIILLPEGQKNRRLLEELKEIDGSVLIFSDSQESCLEVHSHLRQNGVESECIHGDLSQVNRSRLVQRFREGNLRILVATDLLARGLDIPLLETVINFSLPYEPQDFLHRIGRTARAGRAGRAITLVSPEDRKKYEKIKPYLVGAREEN